MATGRLLADDLLPPDSTAPAGGNHPTDSARLLVGLMSLSRQAERADGGDPQSDPLAGIISRGVLRSLLSALRYRDAATVAHSRCVAVLAKGVAQSLGWQEPQLKQLEVAALLHDIGKIGVPDNILFKPGKLSADEAELMALQHNVGVDVLQACRVNREVLEIIAQAHSQYDGPAGAHPGARILAVADAYDSLRTDQAYRTGKPHEEIMATLMEASGARFDGEMVRAVGQWIQAGGELPEPAPPAPGGGDCQSAPADSQETVEAGALCHIFSYLYVLESLYDGFYLVDSDLQFMVWSRGAERLLGYPAGKMLHQRWSSRMLCHRDPSGRPLADQQCPMNAVIDHGRSATDSVQLQRSDGRWIEVEVQSVPLLDRQERLHGVVQIFRDSGRTASRPQEYRAIKAAASRDPLTSVANRGELETRLAMMLAESAQQAEPDPVSVIVLDVDHFQQINAMHGRSVGDRVLVDVGRLLQQEVDAEQLVGRYGGEEFAILSPGQDLQEAVHQAERLRLAMAQSEAGGLKDRRLTASFGVTRVEPGDSVESLLRRAGKALEQAKATGRNRTCSLTVRQLSSEEAAPDPAERRTEDPFLYTGTFQACLAADMAIYKLGGFVDDNKARLKEVAPKRAVIRLGSAGLLPFWGRTDDRRPIELVVEFGNERLADRQTASHRVDVTVRIRPLGWVRDAEAFRRRARRTMKDLRSYFVAD